MGHFKRNKLFLGRIVLMRKRSRLVPPKQNGDLLSALFFIAADNNIKSTKI